MIVFKVVLSDSENAKEVAGREQVAVDLERVVCGPESKGPVVVVQPVVGQGRVDADQPNAAGAK